MQGYELPALKAGVKLPSTASAIFVELEFIELYKNQPLYSDVKNWLYEQGFVLVAGDFDFPRRLNQWWGNELFIRKDLIK